MSKIYHYYVEGDCEKKFIDAFKVSPVNNFIAGKVDVFNFIQNRFSKQRIAVLKPGTIIILVYDIDVNKKDILEENINYLNKHGFKKIIHIQSIKNFEDEIVYASRLSNINQMYNTSSVNEFKTKFMHEGSLTTKLKNISFSIDRVWSRVNNNSPFDIYSSQRDLDFIKEK